MGGGWGAAASFSRKSLHLSYNVRVYVVVSLAVLVYAWKRKANDGVSRHEPREVLTR